MLDNLVLSAFDVRLSKATKLPAKPDQLPVFTLQINLLSLHFDFGKAGVD